MKKFTMKKFVMKKRVSLTLALLSIVLISSCGSYSVSTNLDKQRFKDYFSPTEVKIYQNEQEFTDKHQFIGLVEGQDCQIKAHHAAPDEINARTQARKQAYNQEANAVIFTTCVDIESQQCTKLLVCYAKAYQVSTP